MTNAASETPVYDAIIIGAGFSGLYALHKLRDQEGLKVRAFDAAGGVGGTWWYNRYPGARVDGPSTPYYGYMFSKELAEEWDWTETQSGGPEILSYLEHVADRFDLKKDIQFNTWITDARFDEQTQRWTIETDKGETASAQFLICGLGVLFVPNKPDYPGFDDFSGECYHTGRWPHEEVSFKGKRVGVIGTGSSGIQAIPEIAKEADHVTVFQRTAQYTMPARNRPISKEELTELRAEWGEIREQMRNNPAGFPFEMSNKRADDYTFEERHAVYEELWERGGFGLALQSFKGVMVKRDLNEEIGAFVCSKIRETVEDPQLAEKLSPKYLFGTKRLILDNGYYETYNRDNVALVDISENPIEKFTETGLRTSDAEYPIDMLVLATGFDAVSGSILKLNPKGRDGVSLKQKWQGRFETYFGISIPDFPNLFSIHGPGSPGVFFTIPLGTEQTVDWIADCMQHMKANDLGVVDCTREAAESWGQEVDGMAQHTLYPETPSWYSGANIPGKPKQFLGHLNGVRFYDQLHNVADEGYRGFTFEPASEKQEAG